MASSFPNPSQGMVLGMPAHLLPACAYGAITLFSGPFQATLAWLVRRRLVLHPTSPTGFLVGFGLDFSLFARCYWGNPVWFLFLPLLRCFSSGGSRSLRSAAGPRRSPQQEVPLRDPRIYDCVRLPGAFRSLPRPSSAFKPSHSPDGVSCRA